VPPFVLIDYDAVGDYQRALQYDGCLKRIGVVRNDCNSDAYFAFCRGLAEERDGQIDPQHASFLATICIAVKKLDNLETKMRRMRPDDWFSPHLIARFNETKEITTMVPPLRTKLQQLYATGELSNPGWDVSWIYAGHSRNKRLPLDDPSERELSDKHPFMIAGKKNNGRAIEGLSKRILLNCEIGKRGLNNWPILGVCNFVPHSNPTDDIQFDLGRPCRWKQREDWHQDEQLWQFLTTMHFMPPKLYEKRQPELEEAHKRVLGLRKKVADSKLLTWAALLNGDVAETKEAKFNPPEPLTPEEKLHLANLLGGKLRENGNLNLPPDHIEKLIAFVGP